MVVVPLFTYPASLVVRFWRCILDEKQVNRTMNVPKKSKIIAAKIVHMPTEKYA